MRRDYFISAILVLIVVAVFFPVLRADFLQWDDNQNIYANPHIQKFNSENLKWMLTNWDFVRRYIPCTWLVWGLTASCFGLNPFFFHLEGLLFQSANVVLVFLLLKKILARFVNAPVSAALPAVTGNPRAVKPNPGEARAPSRGAKNSNSQTAISACAGLAALLWAVHPMRVEVVAWANCQVYSQALFFLLLSLWFYFRAAETKPRAGSLLKSRPLWLSVVCFALSLLSYPIALVWVVVLVILDFYGFKRLSALPKDWFKESRAVLVEKVPFVAITGLVVGITFWARAHMSDFWKHTVNLSDFSWMSRAAQAFYIWAYYLWRPFWPVKLSPVYTRLIQFEPMEWPFLVSALLVVGITVILFLKRTRWPLLFALWICHLALLVPMLGLTEHPHYANDRYNFLSSLLWSVLLAVGLAKIWNHKWRVSVIGICVVLIGVFSHLSFRQTQLWNNTVVLLESVIVRLGDTPADRRWQASAYYRIGSYFSGHGNNARAITNYEQALRFNPQSLGALDNLALALAHENRLDEAMERANQALQIDPKNSTAHFNLATILEQAGKPDEALKEYRAAVECDSKNAETQNSLAIALVQSGKVDEALEHFLACLQINPNNPPAHYSAGAILLQQKKLSEALAHFSAAVQLQPEFPEANFSMGDVLAAMDRLPEAVPYFAKAVELNPQAIDYYLPLGLAQAKLGQLQQAATTFRRGIQLAEAAGQKELAAQLRSQLASVEHTQ